MVKPGLAEQLREFKALTRMVVDRAMIDSPDQNLFKPVGRPDNLLRGYAIERPGAAMGFWPVMTDVEWNSIELKLVQLGRTRSKLAAQAFLDGQGELVVAKLTRPVLKSRIKWDKELDGGRVPQQNAGARGEPGEINRVLPFFRCPKCQQPEAASANAFRIHDLDRTAVCKACEKSSGIRLWWCECGMRWHACAKHQGAPDEIRAWSRKAETSKARTKSACRGQGPGRRRISLREALTRETSDSSRKRANIHLGCDGCAQTTARLVHMYKRKKEAHSDDLTQDVFTHGLTLTQGVHALTMGDTSETQ